MVPQPALAYPPSHDGEHQGKRLKALRPRSGAKGFTLRRRRRAKRLKALRRRQGGEREIDRQPCCHRQHLTVGLTHAYLALELLLGISQGRLKLVEGQTLPWLGP